MQVTAYLKSLRIAPRKVRLAVMVVRGMDVGDARAQLRHMGKRASLPMLKLLDSAVANAVTNFGLVKDNLYIKDVRVDGGPMLKRFRPKGFGMASPIEKKTSHVRVMLEEKVPGMKASARPLKTETAEQTVEESTHSTRADRKRAAEEPSTKASGRFKAIRNSARRFFRRKSI